MRKIGELKTRKATEIASSRIGVGFETLDRKMWDDTDEVYRLTGELGVKHARVQTGWCLCEQEAGVYDFAWLDRIVNNLLEQGVQPWFNVGYGNMLHTGAEHLDAVGWAPIYTEESRAAWSRFVAALVAHFRDRVTHYEIWNEPDIDVFWVSGSNPHDYMDLLKLTVPVVRHAYPGAKIIGGALAGGLGQRGAAYLEACLQDGLAELIDVFTFHRYHILSELHRPCDYASLRATFKAYGGEDIELWQAESGCPSVESKTQALANVPVSEEVQAKVLARSILNDMLHGLDYTSYFHLSDFKYYYRNGFTDVPNYFGLLTFDQPVRCKPSYGVMQRICTLFDRDTQLMPRGLVEFSIEDFHNSPERYQFQEEIAAAKCGTFLRNGGPMAVWWQPSDILPSVSGNELKPPRTINVHVWTPQGVIGDPVVVDPLTGEVFEPGHKTNDICAGVDTGIQILTDVPLKDTPMVAVDRSSIDIVGA